MQGRGGSANPAIPEAHNLLRVTKTALWRMASTAIWCSCRFAHPGPAHMLGQRELSSWQSC